MTRTGEVIVSGLLCDSGLIYSSSRMSCDGYVPAGRPGGDGAEGERVGEDG